MKSLHFKRIRKYDEQPQRQVFKNPPQFTKCEGGLDNITVLTWMFFILSLLIFYLIGRFTLNLIKQHYNIYDILFEIEEEETKK